MPVLAVGSHDTASAVAGVPAQGPGFAYISCGTWSLVGMELPEPVLSEASCRANFTNETGIDGTIRYLRNVMGLWLLQESVRDLVGAGDWRPTSAPCWRPRPPRRRRCAPWSTRTTRRSSPPATCPPGSPMPAAAPARTRRPIRAATVRCILDSLALAYRRAIAEVQELSGRHVDTVHIVGGGARNALLCQLTADACGLPVVAGPVEAAAIGNVLVQARALGAAPDDLGGMRELLRRTQDLRRFEPSTARPAPGRRPHAG